MTNLKRAIVAAIAFTSIAISATAIAQRGDGSRQEKMVERISKKLDLTDTQTQALEAFAAELTETRELMRGNGDGMRSELSALISEETFDQGQALALINERTAAIQANAPELVSAAAVFFDGLSAEQKEQAQKLMEKGGHHKNGKNSER